MSSSAAKPRVLVIDDSADGRGLSRDFLARELPEVVVLHAASAEEGLVLAARELPDVVVLNVRLPVMDDCEVCRRLRSDALTAAIPVLMVSAVDVSPEHSVNGLVSGADGFLCRPCDRAELVAQLAALLGRKASHDGLRGHCRDLERTLRERTLALEERDLQVRYLFEHSPDAIFVEDLDGYVLDVNAAACALHGVSREELVGCHVLDLVPPAERERVQGDFPRWANLGMDRYEGFSYTREGVAVPVEIRSRGIRYGGRSAILLHVRDITERKRAEDQLRSYREKLEDDVRRQTRELRETSEAMRRERRERRRVENIFYAALANSPTGTLVTTAAGELVGFNRMMEKITGCTSSQFRTLEALLDALLTDVDVRRRVRIEVRRVLRRRQPAKADYTITHPDGRRLTLRCHISFFEGGAVIQVEDVTERAVMMRELDESRKNFYNIVEKGGDGVVVVDAHGIVRYANRAAGDLFCRPVAELIGSPFACTIKAGETVEMDISREGEYRLGELVGTSTEWDAAPGLLVVIRDITARRRMENELIQAQKLESVGMLAGGIAHDFNNILTGVIGNLSFAKMSGNSPETVLAAVVEAERSALRAKMLTKQLVTFSKGGAPVRETASIGNLLSDASHFVLTGSRSLCRLHLADDLWSADIDAGQISQVIENLVINADQAMPRGGTITIRAENVILGADHPDIHTYMRPGKYVRIAVEDQGEGIDPDVLPRIFDPYYTTKKHGSGLGLASAYSIVRKHEGGIAVQSTVGRGTAFTILLPASSRQAQPVVPVELRLVRGQGRILVVDDEDIVRTVACRILTALGYAAEAVPDGEAALEAYGQALASGARYDAVILDLTIPGGMGGEEILARLKAIDPDVVGIVSSGYADIPIVSSPRAYGFRGVIPKPYDMERMGLVLGGVLASASSGVLKEGP